MRRTSFLYLFRDQQGIVLVMALMLMGLMSALAAAYSTMIRADTVLRGAAGRERQGFYAAEHGLNATMAATRASFDNFDADNPATATSEHFSVGSGAQQRTVDTAMIGVPGCMPCGPQLIGAGQPFAGMRSIPYRYSLTSTAKNSANEEEAKLGAEFTVHVVPIFQFLAFYTNDLYIMPLETMPLNGRIHTNGSLRLNDSDATLSVSDSPLVPLVQVSASGNIFRGANKYGSWTCDPNSVKIDRRSDTTLLDLESCGTTAISQTTLNGYGGSVLAGIPQIQTPPAQRMARGNATANWYWNAADLRIVLDLTAPRLINDPDFPCGPLPGIGLFRIVVQDQNGIRDDNKTRALWRFMCQRRGAIFYTDVPTAAGAAGTGIPIGANAQQTAVSELRGDYSPNFPAVPVPVGMVVPAGASDFSVYRRVGEDTNGDGQITLTDRNRDICPVSENYPVGAAAPWWKPLDCPWPYDNPDVLPTTAALTDDAPPTSWYRNSDYRRGGFYNRREDRWMYLLNVNVRALLEWNARPIDAAVPSNSGGGNALMTVGELGNDGGGGRNDEGVILYLSVQGVDSLAVAPAAANNYGVRIFDSADLDTRGTTFPTALGADPTGITIVSDQAMYIQGNYNSRDKYPAAIMADALNVLSQGWEVPNGVIANDRKSTDSLANRPVPANDFPCGTACGALTPRINAAFIAGVGPSPLAGAGNYDGGLENYPRFHESWSNRPLTISGAFVSLGRSLHAVNNWAEGSGTGGGIYNPPDRPWNYDPDFDNALLLPPMTPRITWLQQRMYTRFYQ